MTLFISSPERNTSQSGQALLMIVLLVALAITVVSAVSFQLTTDIQVTKTQEDSVRALSAADAGIERGIQVNNAGGAAALPYHTSPQTFAAAGIQMTGVDPTQSTILISTTSEQAFVSPDIAKDEQFTFYLGNYPGYTTYFTNDMAFYFGSDAIGSCAAVRSTPAIELTIIYGAGSNQIEKILYEPCNAGDQIGGAYSATKIQGTQAAQSLISRGTTYSFNYNTAANPLAISSYPQAKVIIARVLFAKSRIGFRSLGANVLPTQGKIIQSSARTNSGVTKIVNLYQSMPQIPADFFVTTF